MNAPTGHEVCPQCGGDGYVAESDYEELRMSNIHPCYRCGTSGYVPLGPMCPQEPAVVRSEPPWSVGMANWEYDD